MALIPASSTIDAAPNLLAGLSTGHHSREGDVQFLINPYPNGYWVRFDLRDMVPGQIKFVFDHPNDQFVYISFSNLDEPMPTSDDSMISGGAFEGTDNILRPQDYGTDHKWLYLMLVQGSHSSPPGETARFHWKYTADNSLIVSGASSVRAQLGSEA